MRLLLRLLRLLCWQCLGGLGRNVCDWLLCMVSLLLPADG